MYLITCFKYLYFNYLTTLQTNTQNNLGFSHALLAAHAVWLNTQNCARFGSQISVAFGGLRPQNIPPGALSLDPLGDFHPQTPCAPYLQILPTPLVTTHRRIQRSIACWETLTDITLRLKMVCSRSHWVMLSTNQLRQYNAQPTRTRGKCNIYRERFNAL